MRFAAVGGIALLAVVTACDRSPPSSADVLRIDVDTNPLLDLGVVEGDTSELFSQVVGATRLDDGTVIVGDRGSAQLKYFSRDGRFVRAVGRKGSGPGEFGYMADLLRCGDSVFVEDIRVRGTLVFGIDGGYKRLLQFAPPEAGRSPYDTACNEDRIFLHYAFENFRADATLGPYRAAVPFWTTGPDGAVVKLLGTFPGSERLGTPGGSRPLPLGKQTTIALAKDRAFIGTADAYEIVVLDLDGTPIDTLRKANVDLRTMPEDIELFKQRDLSQSNPALRAQIEREYLTIPFPERIPAYAALEVDARGNLWVQDYPRGAGALTRWSMFSPAGELIAETQLPTRLEIYEIGADYILGKTLEPPDDVEHVRVYRLTGVPGR
jgi:hypothetical protein